MSTLGYAPRPAYAHSIARAASGLFVLRWKCDRFSDEFGWTTFDQSSVAKADWAHRFARRHGLEMPREDPEEGGTMRALTIRQPWAAFIVEGLKTIEVRSVRSVPAPIVQAARRGDRPRIAIHAGKAMDTRAAMFWAREKVKPRRLVFGAVIATAAIAEIRAFSDDHREAAMVPADLLPACDGLAALVLEDVIETGPFPCRGQLGFWRWERPSEDGR